MRSNFEDNARKGRPAVVTNASAAFVTTATKKRHRGTRTVAKMYRASTGQPLSHMTIWRQHVASGLTPWKSRRQPYTGVNIEAKRVAFVDYQWDWVNRNWRLLAPSDEFYVAAVQRPNSQNAVVWARTREEISELVDVSQQAHPATLGLFLLFTSRGLCFRIKEAGESWTGIHFRREIIDGLVKPFLTDPANIAGHVTSTCILHDNAPGWAAFETQQKLRRLRMNFFPSRGDGAFPPYSPMLNPAEWVGSYVQTQSEMVLQAGPACDRYSLTAIRAAMVSVLRRIERDDVMFTRLLRTVPVTFRMLRKSNGRPVRYHK